MQRRERKKKRGEKKKMATQPLSCFCIERPKKPFAAKKHDLSGLVLKIQRVEIHSCVRNYDFSNRAVFNRVSRLLWFCISFYDWLTKVAPLSQPKPIVLWPHTFSRAWRQLDVFDSNCDVLVVLFTSVVIGQSNYFGFGLKTALIADLCKGYYKEKMGLTTHFQRSLTFDLGKNAVIVIYGI